ncbi:transmembrane helix containing protein [Aeromonas phage vB_AspA_Bolek]|nr:transmembrane helix containing protein [Aeromonas phage vB_AspA_Bolek]
MNRVVMLICLLLLLSGCASTPIVRTEVVKSYPPASLMVTCAVPDLNLSTYGAVVEEDVPTLISTIKACDYRFELLRKWATP